MCQIAARVSLALIGIALALCAYAGADTPQLLIEKKSDHLLIIGDVSSTAHEAILRDTAAQIGNNGSTRFDVQLMSPTPPGWALLTDLTLRAVAETQTASATISSFGVDVRGITANPDGWSAAIARANDYLGPGMQLVQNVVVIDAPEALDSVCQRVFREESRANSVKFEESSSTLSSPSFGQLDALAELATDCPGSTITVVGHTDSTGVEASNVALSQARAQAVVSYMITRGVAPGRLYAHGVGSSEPVADNANPRARHKNRRIEFELTFANDVDH